MSEDLFVYEDDAYLYADIERDTRSKNEALLHALEPYQRPTRSDDGHEEHVLKSMALYHETRLQGCPSIEEAAQLFSEMNETNVRLGVVFTEELAQHDLPVTPEQDQMVWTCLSTQEIETPGGTQTMATYGYKPCSDSDDRLDAISILSKVHEDMLRSSFAPQEMIQRNFVPPDSSCEGRYFHIPFNRQRLSPEFQSSRQQALERLTQLMQNNSPRQRSLCSGCKNFNDNPYLHCAVNPSYNDGECKDFEGRMQNA